VELGRQVRLAAHVVEDLAEVGVVDVLVGHAVVGLGLSQGGLGAEAQRRLQGLDERLADLGGGGGDVGHCLLLGS
jgi:hypothetical protein